MSALLSKIDKALAAAAKPASSELTALLTEVEAEIVTANRERAAALDPSITVTDEELQRVAGMTLVKNRLISSVSLLQTKLAGAEARERYQAWKERYDVLEAARDLLAEDLRSLYPDLVHKLIDLLGRIAVNDAAISALHMDRPSGVPLHLKTAEQKARNIDSFTGAAPSITKKLQLPLWAADERLAYPQRDMSMAASMFAVPEQPGDRQRYSSDWHVARQQDIARSAKAAAKRLAEQQEQDRLDKMAFETRYARKQA